MRGCIGKNPSPTSARNKAKIEYISEGQPSPFELTFGVELDPNPHSKSFFIQNLFQEAGKKISNYFFKIS